MRDLFLPPRTAVLSEDGVYRYRLTIPIAERPTLAGRMLFVMLNPSTADAEQDDPTTTACARPPPRATPTRRP